MLIHIGYHKTGTTWLQRQILQPRFGYGQLATHEEIDRLLVRPHGLQFDPLVVRREILDRKRRLPTGLVPTLSSEILSGHPFYGGQGSDVLAHRLAETFPGARILITIRSQNTILPSLYMQYLQRGGTLGYRDFFAGHSQPGYVGFVSAHYEYHRLISLYQDLFGQVCVLTQEAFDTSPYDTLGQLEDFAGTHGRSHYPTDALTRHGTSAPQSAVWVLQKMNHVRVSTLNPAPIVAITSERGLLYRGVNFGLRRLKSWGVGRGTPVSDYVNRHLSPRFAKSNRRLIVLTEGKLDLSAYPQTASSPCFHGSALTTEAGPTRVL